MKTFAKKYQLWVQNPECSGFVPFEFDTLNECVMQEKIGDWYITKGVSLVVTEEGGSPLPVTPVSYGPTFSPATITTSAPTLPVDEDTNPEEAALAATYASGPIGKSA